MAMQIMPCSIPVRAGQQSGTYQDGRSSEALLGQPFPVAGSWWLQPTLTATANRTLCFTDPPRVKQRYGISITTFTSAPLTARLSRPAGAWPKGAWSKTLADAETGIIEGLRDAHPDYLLFNS